MGGGSAPATPPAAPTLGDVEAQAQRATLLAMAQRRRRTKGLRYDPSRTLLTRLLPAGSATTGGVASWGLDGVGGGSGGFGGTSAAESDQGRGAGVGVGGDPE